MQKKSWRLPPRIKVLEALGAVADGRVELGDSGANVISSSRNKTYEVRFDSRANRITSNDNATFYVGYLGYPVVAYLFAAGLLAYDSVLATHFESIHWKALNTKLGNDYDALEELLLSEMPAATKKSVTKFMEVTLDRLDRLQLGVLESDRRPPVGW